MIEILETTPERLSPNALLRPVFQDTVLPTAAYVGGPAEIAYFAQSAVLYEAILGRITPVLPRLSATLLETAISAVMDKDEVQLPDAMTTAEELAQRLGARAIPIEGKRKLATVGNALDIELNALTEYLAGMDASLGRAADVSGSKMRYQMNRLRRMAATFELQKQTSLAKTCRGDYPECVSGRASAGTRCSRDLVYDEVWGWPGGATGGNSEKPMSWTCGRAALDCKFSVPIRSTP